MQVKELAPRLGGNQGFFIYTFSKDAIVWIDALQMEAGAAPSDFSDRCNE